MSASPRGEPTQFQTARNGYSPTIAAQLHIGDQRFDLAAINATRIVLRCAHAVPPGPAALHMQIDGKETVTSIYMTNGVDPSLEDQPYKKSSRQ